MKYFRTEFSLPPGAPPSSVVRECFQLIFETYRWFRPVKYGRASLSERLDPDRIDFNALVAYYERYKNITVTARTDRDYFIFMPVKPDDPPYTGSVIWGTSAKAAEKAAWRAEHLHQMREVMRLVRAPLAQAGLDEDFEKKTRRLVADPDGLSAIDTFTVRDYSEGLAGLFWRNFFGPPFTRMFGERLSNLSPAVQQEIGDGIILLQPYELPTQAGTPEGVAAERQLISQLGPECFYDHERHLKPTRRPEL
ncbi:MAG TPA: hypothetical protein VF815_17600 [Myxococcaceae bacterium]